VFGGVTQIRESYRAQRGLPWLEEAMRDIRFAFRKLLHSPGFALTAILTGESYATSADMAAVGAKIKAKLGG